jgi:hypothetical protein
MKRSSRSRWCAVVAFQALSLSACGDAEDESELGPPPSYPIPGCEALDPRPCDTRRADCQSRLFEIAACLRGDEAGDPPPIITISPDEYAERLRALYAEDPPEDTTSLEHTLALFALSEEGSFSADAEIERARTSVWGVYAQDQAQIWLIDREEPLDGLIVNAVLVHEFAHALQDRAVGFEAFYEAYASNRDSWLAVTALVEGEAELTEYRYATSALGLDPTRIDLSRALESDVASRWDALQKSGSAIASSRSLFAYSFGARYLNRVFQTGGTRALADVWASPPTTTQAFFASENGVVTPDFEPVRFDTLVAAGGVNPTYELTLGAWGLFVLLAKHGATFEAANEGAQAWRGDRYESYEVDDAAAAIWRIELADERMAREFALQLSNSKIRARATGTTIRLGVGDPGLPIDWAFDQ